MVQSKAVNVNPVSSKVIIVCSPQSLLILNSNSDPNAPVARTAKSLTENDIVGEDREEKTVKLFDATLDAASNFMSSHNLEVKFPKEMTAGFARSIEEGKKHKTCPFLHLDRNT